MATELRPYQEKGINGVFEAMRQGHDKILLCLACGLGKTTLMGKIIEMGYLRGKKILIVVHRDNLVRQFAERLRDQFNVPCGYILGTEKKDYQQPVQVSSRQSLSRRLGVFPSDHFDLTIIDEAHYAASNEYKKILDHFKQTKLCGLSVGPDSTIEVKGSQIGNFFVGKIEHAWNTLSERLKIKKIGELELIKPKELYTRGFDGDNFTWKKVKSVIRHKCTKPCTILNVGGDDLLLTNDHSIFKIAKYGNLVEINTDKLTKGDITAIDSGHNGEGDKEINLIDLFEKINYIDHVHVAVDLSNITHEQFKEFGINYKQKWAYKNRGAHGNMLPFKYYLKMKHLLPEPKLIYREGSSSWILPKIKMSDYAYLIGLYYGNGWFGESSIDLSIKDAIVQKVYLELSELKNVKTTISIKKCPGKAKEISISNHMLFTVLKDKLGNKKCYDKTIESDFILEWDEYSKRELLRGLINTDGHVSEKNTKRYVSYCTTSLSLARTLKSLLRSLDVLSGIHPRKFTPNYGGVARGRKINGNAQSYSVNWSLNSQEKINEGRKGKVSKYGWLNEGVVRKTTPSIKNPEYVYDIEVDGHPSFVANGILVHNSASPFRADGKPLKGIFDVLVHPIKCKEAIELGYLCSAEHFAIGNINMEGVAIRKGEYDEKEMYARFKEWDITEHVVKEIKKANGQSIVFCINVAHTLEIYEAIKAVGVNAAYVTGSTKVEERNKIYKQFNSNKIQVLCNCEILTEGADFPPVLNIFLVKKMRSLARYLQCVGRGARPYQDGLYIKPGFNVIDFGGNVEMHGFFEDYDEDLTLTEGAEKNTRKPKPRKCPQCGKVLMTKECSDCGFLFEEDEKEKIKIGELEIVALTKNILNYTRLSKKKWEKVKDYELRLYAKIKGMKVGWALHQYAERHSIDKGMDWHIKVNMKLAELEKENNQEYE